MDQTRRKHILVLHAKYFALILVVFATYVLTGIGCPIYNFIGIRCPTCGVTRALRGLLSGDLEQYFRMNPFAIPLVVAAAVGIHLSAVPIKWRNCGMLYIAITVVSTFSWYVYSFV